MSCSKPQMERPVMFMETKNGKLSISEEAAAVLRAIDKPAVVVAIAGKYRTGKSYLMNRLFGGSAGFSLGSTVQSHTQGFWLWAKPHPYDPEKWLILIDVEGLSDVEKGDRTYDTKLFSLTILLCSCLVYNGIGTIDNDAVQQLHFVTQLTEHIKMRAEGEEDGNDFDKFFPSFYWVVRDFTLELEIDGKSCTEDEYLEHALKLKKGRGKAVEDFNRPREYIRDFFTKRKCFVVCKPIDDDRIQHLETVPDSELKPKFLASINKVCSTIFEEVKTFKVGTTTINGPRLLFLAEKYTEAINQGAVPCIGTAVDLMRDTECQKAIDEAVAKYISEMDQRVLSKLPMDPQELSEENITAQTIATDVYHKTAVFDAEGKYQEKLKNILIEKCRAYVERNERSSREKCQQILAEIYQPIQYKIKHGQYSGKGCYKIYKSDYDNMIQRYKCAPNKGPCADETLQEFLNQREAEGLAILQNDKAMSKKEKELAQVEQQRENERLQRQRADEEAKRLQQELVDTQESNLVMMQQAKEEFDKKIQQVNVENKQAMEARESEWKRLMEEGLQRQADMHKEAVEELQKDKEELNKAHRQRMAAMEESINRQEHLIREIRENPPKQEKGFLGHIGEFVGAVASGFFGGPIGILKKVFFK